MGWTFQDEPLRGETPAARITRLFTHEGASQRLSVLAAATVRGTVYAAVRVEDRTTGRAHVLCAVVLVRNSLREGFGYKEMDETMGPAACDPPAHILALLSPVEDIPNPRFAAAWRARVAERAAARAREASARRRLAVGDVLRPPAPVRLTGGHEAVAFRVAAVRARGNPVFETADAAGLRCRLPVRLIAACAVVRGGEGAP